MLTDGKVSFRYICAPGGAGGVLLTHFLPVPQPLQLQPHPSWYLLCTESTSTDRPNVFGPQTRPIAQTITKLLESAQSQHLLRADLTFTYSTDVRCPIFYLLQLDESHISNAQSTNPLIHPKLERDTFTPGDRGIPSMVILYY